MGSMTVYWRGSVHQNLTGANNNTYVIEPAESSIARGQTVGFADDEIIGFRVEGSSAYIRFWLSAVANGTDYSQYFTLAFYVNEETEQDENANVSIVTGLDNPETGVNENATMYYYDYAIGTKEGYNQFVISGITFAEDVPIELLGTNNLTITLYYEAVQASNGAFQSVFDDWRGYSTEWK